MKPAPLFFGASINLLIGILGVLAGWDSVALFTSGLILVWLGIASLK